MMRNLKLLLLVPALLLLAACTVQPEYPSAEEAEKAVIAKEREALDNWSAGQPSGYSIHFSENASYCDDIAAFKALQGIDACNEYFKTLDGMVPPHDYELIDPNVQTFENTAVLTFHYVGIMDGEKAPPWKASIIYRFMEDDWKVAHANWSMVPEPEEPAQPE